MTETEVSPRGKTIFPQGAGPVEHVWVVRSGSVEVVYDGRVLDLLGPGELFGHASMISGLPTGFEARAAEDTVCYRIPVGRHAPAAGPPGRAPVRRPVDRGPGGSGGIRGAGPTRCRAGSPR